MLSFNFIAWNLQHDIQEHDDTRHWEVYHTYSWQSQVPTSQRTQSLFKISIETISSVGPWISSIPSKSSKPINQWMCQG